jgi:hypothetical protein
MRREQEHPHAGSCIVQAAAGALATASDKSNGECAEPIALAAVHEPVRMTRTSPSGGLLYDGTLQPPTAAA